MIFFSGKKICFKLRTKNRNSFVGYRYESKGGNFSLFKAAHAIARALFIIERSKQEMAVIGHKNRNRIIHI